MQADLSLRGAHMSKDTFSEVVSYILILHNVYEIQHKKCSFTKCEH